MRKPFTLQVIRGGEVTLSENARSFAEAMSMAHVHLAPDVEVLILLDGQVHAKMRQPQWRQVLHSQLATRNVDITGNSEPANRTEAQ